MIQLTLHLLNIITLSQMTNFRTFQTGRVCKPQFQIRWKWWEVLQTGRKHFGKRRNFSFSNSVFKRLVLQTCKNKGLFGKVLKHYHINMKITEPYPGKMVSNVSPWCSLPCKLSYTVKPVLGTNYIKQSTTLSNRCPDTTPLLKSTK